MSSTNTPWFAVSVGLMGLIVGFGFSNFAGTAALPRAAQPVAQVPQVPDTAPTPPAPPATPPTVDDDTVLGQDSATLTIVEFTDFQCPFCSRHFNDTFGQIKKEYIDTGKVKYVSRDFPLSFHPHAQLASEAAECADDQGKFWEMHDKLFSAQAAWSNLPDAKPTFKQYAADMKLNTATFDDCLDTGKHTEEVQKDEADGIASGINGTPGFWILKADGTGQMISGAVPFASFKQTLDSML